MKKENIDAQLISAVQTRITENRGVRLRDTFALARTFITDHPDLIERWALVKVAIVFQQQINAMSRPAQSIPEQMILPGFHSLSQRLPLHKGWVALGQATILKLRESITAIRERAKASSSRRVEGRLTPIRELIEKMSPYAEAHHGITVSEYVELKETGTVKKKAGKVART